VTTRPCDSADVGAGDAAGAGERAADVVTVTPVAGAAPTEEAVGGEGGKVGGRNDPTLVDEAVNRCSVVVGFVDEAPLQPATTTPAVTTTGPSTERQRRRRSASMRRSWREHWSSGRRLE
jgi:hypothetical protein